MLQLSTSRKKIAAGTCTVITKIPEKGDCGLAPHFVSLHIIKNDAGLLSRQAVPKYRMSDSLQLAPIVCLSEKQCSGITCLTAAYVCTIKTGHNNYVL
jgi:hypothetical protein